MVCFTIIFRCQQYCQEEGYSFAGVTYGTKCFCGNEQPAPEYLLPESKCDLPCVHNGNEDPTKLPLEGEENATCGGRYLDTIDGVRQWVDAVNMYKISACL